MAISCNLGPPVKERLRMGLPKVMVAFPFAEAAPVSGEAAFPVRVCVKPEPLSVTAEPTFVIVTG